ncbi:unnamed protein product [Kuraishia capsulata CBS 1993]|uniref:SEC7 domain-containing protein n=1 Tax=Kuraishia capsulata CBS 1993 TaxID=1382522 RepID=W6MJC0_9ASCO|nr:uncharacterized protein KUCA_T00002597001 [Kuraishia capsulata CBS 1993]CDK26624.1 unnamed protein product [Kuraishia capsulata CBS 1993]
MDSLANFASRDRKDAKTKATKKRQTVNRTQTAPVSRILPKRVSLFALNRSSSSVDASSAPGLTSHDVLTIPRIYEQLDDSTTEQDKDEPSAFQKAHRKFSSTSLSSIFLPLGALTKRSPTVSSNSSSVELPSPSEDEFGDGALEIPRSETALLPDVLLVPNNRPVSFQSVDGRDKDGVVDSDRVSRQRSKTLDETTVPQAVRSSVQEQSGNGRVMNSLASFGKKIGVGGTGTCSSHEVDGLRAMSSNEEVNVAPSGLQLEETILEPHEDESVEDYVERILEEYPFRKVVATLSLHDDEFKLKSLSSFLETYFDFSEEPLDLALRKFLAFNELPTETQQIDRVVQVFSERYWRCNEQACPSPDHCYVLTFSMIMLHTDKFNRNSKRKMTKIQFKNNTFRTLEEVNHKWFDYSNDDFCKLVTKDILDYFYDNITHTPFIKYDGDLSESSLSILQKNTGSPKEPPSLPSPSAVMNTSLPMRRKSGTLLWTSEVIDPYEYIMENKINELKLSDQPTNCNPFLSQSESVGRCNGTKAWVMDNLSRYPDTLDIPSLSDIHHNLTQPRCSIVLKLYKARATWLLSKDKIAASVDSSSASFLLVRVFKIGFVSRSESKLMGTGKQQRQYFCLLTSVGLLFYRDRGAFKFDLENIKKDDGEMVIIEEKIQTRAINGPSGTMFETSEPAFFISLSDLFASRMRCTAQEMQLTLFIFSNGTKTAYLVEDEKELTSWITTINAVSAVSSCDNALVALTLTDEENANGSMVEALFMKSGGSISSIIGSLETSLEESVSHILVLSTLSEAFANLTPFGVKTREMLALSTKLLNAKLEWMWYEAQRDYLFRQILKTVEQSVQNDFILSRELEKLDLDQKT